MHAARRPGAGFSNDMYRHGRQLILLLVVVLCFFTAACSGFSTSPAALVVPLASSFSSLCAGTTILKVFIYISVFFNGLYEGRLTPKDCDDTGIILFV